MAAQISAFGSNDAYSAFRVWRDRMDVVKREYQEIGFYWTETPGGHGPVEMERLRACLRRIDVSS